MEHADHQRDATELRKVRPPRSFGITPCICKRSDQHSREDRQEEPRRQLVRVDREGDRSAVRQHHDRRDPRRPSSAEHRPCQIGHAAGDHEFRGRQRAEPERDRIGGDESRPGGEEGVMKIGVVDRIRIPPLHEGIEIRQSVVEEESDAGQVDSGVGGENRTVTSRKHQLDRDQRRLDGQGREQQASHATPRAASQHVDESPADEPGEQDHRDRHGRFDEVSDRDEGRQDRETAHPRNGDAGKESAFQFFGEEPTGDRIPGQQEHGPEQEWKQRHVRMPPEPIAPRRSRRSSTP